MKTLKERQRTRRRNRNIKRIILTPFVLLAVTLTIPVFVIVRTYKIVKTI